MKIVLSIVVNPEEGPSLSFQKVVSEDFLSLDSGDQIGVGYHDFVVLRKRYHIRSESMFIYAHEPDPRMAVSFDSKDLLDLGFKQVD